MHLISYLKQCLGIVVVIIGMLSSQEAFAAPTFNATVSGDVITATLKGVEPAQVALMNIFYQQEPFSIPPPTKGRLPGYIFSTPKKEVSTDGTITWTIIARGDSTFYVRAEEYNQPYISPAFKLLTSANKATTSWPLTSTEAKGTSVYLGGKLATTHPEDFDIILYYSRTQVSNEPQLPNEAKPQTSSASNAAVGIATDGTYGFSLRGLTPSSLYFTKQVVTSKKTGIVVETQYGSFNSTSGIVLDPVAIDDDLAKRSYTLLAPLPWMKVLLDQDLCKEYEAAGKSTGGIACDNQIGSFINMLLTVLIGLSAVVLVVKIIILGFQYMTTDIPFVKINAKSGLITSFMGLLLALSSYLILNTINPKLVTGTLGVEGIDIGVEQVYDRANDGAFIARLGSVSTAGITADLNDSTFLIYLAHQQGVGGANAILQAAKSGTSPSSGLMRNMSGNFNRADAQKTIGTSVLTPANFLNHWSIKVAAFKKNPGAGIPNDINTKLSQVSQETGVPLATLQVMCRIESGCSGKSSIESVNAFGYAGLFQLSNATHMKKKIPGVWEEFKKPDGILLDAYHNAYAAAQLAKSNLSKIKR